MTLVGRIYPLGVRPVLERRDHPGRVVLDRARSFDVAAVPCHASGRRIPGPVEHTGRIGGYAGRITGAAGRQERARRPPQAAGHIRMIEFKSM